MVKRKFGYLMGVVALLLLTGAKQDNSIVSTEKDLTVINTTELTKDVRGFKGSTPVKIYIKKNKVVRIELCPIKKHLVSSIKRSHYLNFGKESLLQRHPKYSLMP